MSGPAAVVSGIQWIFSNLFKQFSWIKKELHASDEPDLTFARARSSVPLYYGRTYGNDRAIFVRRRNGKIVKQTVFFDVARGGVLAGLA